MRQPANLDMLNALLQSELGVQPRYAWRWGGDLLHVGIKGELHPVFPGLVDRWVMCALIELSPEEGLVHGTGEYGWVPIHDRRTVPVALNSNEVPDTVFTWRFIRQIRKFREEETQRLNKYVEQQVDPATVMDENLKQLDQYRCTRAERKKYEETLTIVQDAGAAFAGIPGEKGSTAFQVGGTRDEKKGTPNV